MSIGKNNWVFCDGYLPPKGDNPEFEGHKALLLTNLNNEKARIELTLVFEDKDPVGGIFVDLDGMRTTCVRMDHPLGEDKFQLCACFGRLDIRQTNMAYYSVEGYSF